MTKRVRALIAMFLAIILVAGITLENAGWLKAQATTEDVATIYIHSAEELMEVLGDEGATLEGNTVTLLKDYTLTSILEFAGGDININCNGFYFRVARNLDADTETYVVDPYYITSTGGSLNFNNDGGINTWGKGLIINGGDVSFTVNANPSGWGGDHDGAISITGVSEALIMYSGTLYSENSYISASTGTAFAYSGGTVLIDNILLSGYTYGVLATAVDENDSFTVNGGSINGSSGNTGSIGVKAEGLDGVASKAHYIVNGGTFNGSNDCFSISGGYLEVNDGQFNPNYGHDYLNYSALSCWNGAKTTIRGGTFRGKTNAVYLSGANATISGGTFTTELNNGIYAYKSKLAISDGTFTGVNSNEYCGVYLWYSRGDISGGTFSGDFALDSWGTGPSNVNSQDCEVTISGGTFTGNTCGLRGHDTNYVITGGTIKANLYEGAYLEDCNVTATGGDFTGTIGLKTAAYDTAAILTTSNDVAFHGTDEGVTYGVWLVNPEVFQKISLNGGTFTKGIYVSSSTEQTLSLTDYIDYEGGAFLSTMDGEETTKVEASDVDGVCIIDENSCALMRDCTITPATNEIKSHGITYANMEGATNSESNVTTITEGSVVTLKEPSKEGYYFGGWYLEDTFENAVSVLKNVTEDTTVYAQWTKKPEPNYGGVKKAAQVITGTQNYELEQGKTLKLDSAITKGDGAISYKSSNWYVATVDQSGTGTVTLTGTTKKRNNKGFKKLTIPNTVKIKGKTFRVTAVGSKAFYKYSYLTSVTVGGYVTSIGSNAFAYDKKLKTITVRSNRLKSVGTNAIKNIYKKATIKVPAKKKKAYKKLFTKKRGFKSPMKVK